MFHDEGENALETAIRLLATWRHLTMFLLVGGKLFTVTKPLEDHCTQIYP